MTPEQGKKYKEREMVCITKWEENFILVVDRL